MVKQGRPALPFTKDTSMATIKSPHRDSTQQTRVLALLRRAKGATLRELGTATGWQRASTRAAICRLRKQGLPIVTAQRDGEICYRLEDKA